MINIDMWYEDKPEEVTGIDWSFSDLDCVYRGNLCKNEKRSVITKRTRCKKFKKNLHT
jgi:hypothetical protein